jgi:uncharacterized alpha-E superfamily protein
LNDAQELLDDLVLAFAAYNGLVTENMIYGLGWRFLNIGRRLERAIQTTRLLQTTLGQCSDAEDIVMEQLLMICDSLLTYRNRYRTQVHVVAVLDLLLQDETNPRSLIFQLDVLQRFIAELPHDNVYSYKSRQERIALELISRVRLADPSELAQCQPSPERPRPELEDLMQHVGELIPELSDVISNSYFSHIEPTTQLVHQVAKNILP